MKIFNSLTNKLEDFVPIKEGHVSMYVCGPTVYNYVHIGNMRPVITFDMVYNYFKYLGYNVTYASNFTDINPKITAAALELNTTEREIADKFIEAYLDDLKNYNCENITYRPRVIDNLDNIFNFIKLLIEKDYAYVKNNDVYFRISKIKNYGVLSNQNIDLLESGKRLEINDIKEDPLDFALWRSSDTGEVFDSPWGKGIPGWHTECVVMINAIFGPKIDIHGGGIDLKFPHHENEIAQSIALNNTTIANYWMHNGHINLDGEKMSKSLGNIILAKDFIQKYSANIIKIAMFKTHYRLPLNFSDSLFDEAKTLNEKIYNTLKNANLINQINKNEVNKITKDEKINEIMDNDFNTPNLLTYLIELIKELNIKLRNKDNISNTFDKVMLICNILGLKYDLRNYSENDIELYNNWITLKDNKDFDSADKIRQELINREVL